MTWWFTVEPGDRTAVSEEDGPQGGVAVLLDMDGPLSADRVRLPLQLGGREVRVLGRSWDLCPCGASHESDQARLEGGIYVADCPAGTFLWFRLKSPNGA